MAVVCNRFIGERLNYYQGGKESLYTSLPALIRSSRSSLSARCLHRSCLFPPASRSPRCFLSPRSPCLPDGYSYLPVSYTATACLASCEGRPGSSPMSPLVKCQGDLSQKYLRSGFFLTMMD